MDFFNSGRHSINKKYERFSDVHKISTKYRKRTRIYRSAKNPDSELNDFVLPARREIYGKKRVNISRRLRAITPVVYIVLLYSKFCERMRRIRESRASAVLGYIPIKLFIGLSLITFGLYPYTWIWGNVYAFIAVGGKRIDENSIKRLVVAGFCVQALLPAAAVSYLAYRFIGAEAAYGLSVRLSELFVFLYFFLVFPMKCFNYFILRWTLRNAVIGWDRDSVMIGRTMTSWLKLFVMGSLYIQYHINRLMGLGMPGFADASEIEMDVSIAELIDNLVISGKSDRDAASWTKDDWESEYEDTEEDDG
jgi:hypothetical protein